jgi:ribosomal RNA-processing protein 1
MQRSVGAERPYGTLVYYWPKPQIAHNNTFDHSPDDPRVPASLTYHISDIYLEELDKVLAEEAENREDATHSAPAPLDALIRPFFAIACQSTTKVKCLHVQNTVIVPLFVDLQTASGASSKAGGKDAEIGTPPAQKRPRLDAPSGATYPHVCTGSTVTDVEKGVTDGARNMLPGEVRKKLLAVLFEMASAGETRDANRRRLYAVWKEMKADDDDDEDEEEETGDV